MSDNSPTVSTLIPQGFFALDGHAVLDLEGPDAIAFAQSQLASDLSGLVPGHWQWSCWLNPKGRVIAVLALLRTGETSLRMLLPDFDAGEMAQAMRRFVFRRKLTLVPRPDLHPAAAFAAPPLASGATLAIDPTGTCELDWGAPGLPRTLRLCPAPVPSDADAAQAWTAADLRLGLPRLPASQREQWTPQQLGLERLAAYSVSKGCYPGQEIVARTHFLGKAKRTTVLLQVADTVLTGERVLQSGQEIGTVVAVAAATPPLALAVLPLERNQEPLRAGDGEAVPQPFLEGLGR